MPERKDIIMAKNTNRTNYLEALLDIALDIREGNKTWADAEAFARKNGDSSSADVIRQGFRYVFKLYDAGYINQDNEKYIKDALSAPANITIREDGSREMDRLVALYEGTEELTKDEMLGFFHLNPEDWVITSSKVQAWHGQKEHSQRQILYNLRLNVRPKVIEDFGISDIESFIRRNAGGIALPAVPKFPKTNRKVKVVKQIDYTDPHVGLLAWKPETGEHYDLNIARNYTLKCFEEFVERNRAQRIDEIVLVTMGDILHVDNGNLETTHGTKQDCEGRVPKMIDTAVATLVQCVRKLEELQVPIRYVYVPGNHDQNLGYAVARLVEATLVADKNVQFDVSPALYKCLEYGGTTVLVTHGEAPNKRLPNELLTKYRDAYGRAGAAEVHAGHLHSESVEPVGAVLVRRVPAICPSSYWEASKGYPAVCRGMQAFTYQSDVAGCVGIEYYYTH